MREELRASLEALREDFDRQVEELKDMQKRLKEVSATAKTKNGLVTVVVGPQGKVKDIRFDPRVYRKYSPTELAAAVLDLIGQASSEVTNQTKELITPFMPEGITFEDALGEEGDFTALLPEPGTPVKGEEGPADGHV